METITLENVTFSPEQAPFRWWMSEQPPFDIVGRDNVKVASVETGVEAARVCGMLNEACGGPADANLWGRDRLVDAGQQLRHARELVRQEEQAFRDRARPLRDREQEFTLRFCRQVASRFGLDPKHVSLSRIPCKESPAHFCTFDSEHDLCWDVCLFCGHPSDDK